MRGADRRPNGHGLIQPGVAQFGIALKNGRELLAQPITLTVPNASGGADVQVVGGLTKVEAGALQIAAAMAAARTDASPAAWQEIPHRAAALAWWRRSRLTAGIARSSWWTRCK